MSKQTKPGDDAPALINKNQSASIINQRPEQNNHAPEQPPIVLPKATARALKKQIFYKR